MTDGGGVPDLVIGKVMMALTEVVQKLFFFYFKLSSRHIWESDKSCILSP